MEGIYTVDIDGSNEQQLTTSGSVPAWQSVDPTPVAVAQAGPPKPPNTGYGPAASPNVGFLLPAVLLLIAGTSLIIVGFRKHRLDAIAHDKER